MEQELKKKYIIIGIVAAVLIILGVIFYQKKDNQIQTNDNLESEVSETQNDKTKDEVKTNSGEAVVISNSDNFNKAILNAQNSFLSKNYTGAINYYNQALKYLNSDLAYSGMFNVYLAQKDWTKAQTVLDKAIALNPLNTDYWKWKLTLLDEQTNTTFSELKKIYEEGMVKSLPKTRINLIVHFARIAGSNGQKAEAIALWQRAIELNPPMKATYQAEIDALNK